jgi:hypothetical protein
MDAMHRATLFRFFYGRLINFGTQNFGHSLCFVQSKNVWTHLTTYTAPYALFLIQGHFHSRALTLRFTHFKQEIAILLF